MPHNMNALELCTQSFQLLGPQAISLPNDELATRVEHLVVARKPFAWCGFTKSAGDIRNAAVPEPRCGVYGVVEDEEAPPTTSPELELQSLRAIYLYRHWIQAQPWGRVDCVFV